MEEPTRTRSHGDYWFIVQYKGFNRCIEIECVERSSHPSPTVFCWNLIQGKGYVTAGWKEKERASHP